MIQLKIQPVFLVQASPNDSSPIQRLTQSKIQLVIHSKSQPMIHSKIHQWFSPINFTIQPVIQSNLQPMI